MPPKRERNLDKATDLQEEKKLKTSQEDEGISDNEEVDNASQFSIEVKIIAEDVQRLIPLAELLQTESTEEAILKAIEAIPYGDPSLNRQYDHGVTLLHNALYSRNAIVVEALLDKGADVLIKDDKGQAPLSALVSGWLYVHKTGEWIELDSVNGDEDLYQKAMRTIENQDKRINDTYLINEPQCIDGEMVGREKTLTLLLMYLLSGQECSLTTIQALLEKGLDVNHKHPDTGGTALHNANISGVVECLVRAGANLEVTNNKGQTSLESMELDCLIESIVKLIECGADFSKRPLLIHELIEMILTVDYFDCDYTVYQDIKLLFKKRPEFCSLINCRSDIGTPLNELLFRVSEWQESVTIEGMETTIEDVNDKIVDIADWLLENGADVKLLDSKAHTPLYRVALLEDRELATTLEAKLKAKGAELTVWEMAELRERADPTLSINRHVHCLSILLNTAPTEEAVLAVIKALPDNDPILNKQWWPHKVTLLYYALHAECPVLVDALLNKKGIDVQVKDVKGQAPLSIMLSNEMFYHDGSAWVMRRESMIVEEVKDGVVTPVNLVLKAIDTIGVDIARVNEAYRYSDTVEDTLLHLYLHNLERTIKPNKMIVGALIGKCVDVNQVSYLGGATTLHVINDLDIIQMLIVAGAEVNKPNSRGKTALQTSEAFEKLLFLIANGAYVRGVPMLLHDVIETILNAPIGERELLLESFKKCAESAPYLIGIVDSRDNLNGTPLTRLLTIAPKYDDRTVVALVDILLEMGANVNLPGGVTKDTPLHLAMTMSTPKLAKVLTEKLISKGAITTTTNTDKETPENVLVSHINNNGFSIENPVEDRKHLVECKHLLNNPQHHTQQQIKALTEQVGQLQSEVHRLRNPKPTSRRFDISQGFSANVR